MTDFFVIALETRHLRSRGPTVELPAEAPGEGPPRLFQLLGAPGVRPWAGGCLTPVSASASTWLLLCIPASPFLSLSRTLSLGLGPPPPRRTSSQTLLSITSAETLFHVNVSPSVVSDSLQPRGLWPARLLSPWDSPGKNTGVGCHCLLQGSSRPRDRTRVSCVSCVGRYLPYH